ncbi:hypothetical protein [Streptomyces gibsoniae]|uniref:Uncharacterized protein n=1 Tax=Streptomyces gibsoniae TaxID=3075529 RepID=A0ABU2U215_9ACTN|nr:hypothetical protein [Streptomyces sp. DSM 41699]MDT0467249.1 hypothetical protein [Streptomyces sp. DSM 41699]
MSATAEKWSVTSPSSGLRRNRPGGSGSPLRDSGPPADAVLTHHGALGNISGGLTADAWNHQDGSAIGWDAATNTVTGAVGNTATDAHFHHMEEHDSVGGEYLGDRGKLADAAYKDSISTGLNTAAHAAGSGIVSDFQNLAEDVERAGE